MGCNIRTGRGNCTGTQKIGEACNDDGSHWCVAPNDNMWGSVTQCIDGTCQGVGSAADCKAKKPHPPKPTPPTPKPHHCKIPLATDATQFCNIRTGRGNCTGTQKIGEACNDDGSHWCVAPTDEMWGSVVQCIDAHAKVREVQQTAKQRSQLH